MSLKTKIKRRLGHDEYGDIRARQGGPRSFHYDKKPHLPEDVSEGLDPVKKGRLYDLIELFRDATEPNDYYDRDIEDPEEVIDMIRKEFGSKIADQVASGEHKMHFPRHEIQRSDPLGWKKPVDRITKAGKMYKQDSDYMKNTIKSRYELSGKSATESVAEGTKPLSVGDTVTFRHEIKSAPGSKVKASGKVEKIEGDTIHVKVKDKYGVRRHQIKMGDVVTETADLSKVNTATLRHMAKLHRDQAESNPEARKAAERGEEELKRREKKSLKTESYQGKSVKESIEDDLMQLAKDRGINVRKVGSREEEQARADAQRGERQEHMRQSALQDYEKIPELQAEYDRLMAKFKSLGGSNYQYADREQNLTQSEREARDIHGQLNFLYQRINAAKKAAGKSK